MRRPVQLLLAFAAALVATLWALGVFRGEAPKTPPAPPPAPPPGPTETDLAAPEPVAEPAPEVPELLAPAELLVVGEAQRSFTSWLLELWRFSPRIRWRTWVHTTVEGQVPSLAHGTEPLAAAPAEGDLDRATVLVLAGVDPARHPPAFWAAVADRVRAGRLGLLVLADYRFAHALAREPSLAGVLPVADVASLSPPGRGAPIPGVSDAPRPFAVTDAGVRHPATRIVPFPGWSRRLWARFAHAKGGWATKQVAPVGRAEGETLVEVEGGDRRWPAVVATTGAARVLWVGGMLEIDWEVYRRDADLDPFRAMAISWVAWLSPPPP